MNTKKILVTGGTGFIGANLIRKLTDRGFDTTLILRKESNLWRIKDVLKKVRVLEVDLLNKNKLLKEVDKIKPNIVYHLAAYGAYSYQDDAEKILSTNIFGTLNLLNSCNNTDLNLFVNTGSSSEYGFKEKPMKETDLLEPNSYYATAKAAQTHLCNYYYKNFNLPVVTLRPFSVYGPYEEPGRLIPNIMKSFYQKTELKMVSKSIVRDFIYIDDYIDLCLKIENLKKYPGQIFNVGSGFQTNFSNLLDIFKKVVKTEGKITWETNKGKSWDTKSWRADITKTSKLIEFKPRNSIEQGLQKSWKWFKTNNQFYLDKFNENN